MKKYSGKQSITYKVGNRTVTDFRSPISIVYVGDQILESKMIVPRSDTKFRTYAWGYFGIYSLNLAVSMMCDFLGIEDYADLYKDYETVYVLNEFYDFVGKEKSRSWTISEKDFSNFITRTLDKSEREANEKQ